MMVGELGLEKHSGLRYDAYFSGSFKNGVMNPVGHVENSIRFESASGANRHITVVDSTATVQDPKNCPKLPDGKKKSSKQKRTPSSPEEHFPFWNLIPDRPRQGRIELIDSVNNEGPDRIKEDAAKEKLVEDPFKSWKNQWKQKLKLIAEQRNEAFAKEGVAFRNTFETIGADGPPYIMISRYIGALNDFANNKIAFQELVERLGVDPDSIKNTLDLSHSIKKKLEDVQRHHFKAASKYAGHRGVEAIPFNEGASYQLFAYTDGKSSVIEALNDMPRLITSELPNRTFSGNESEEVSRSLSNSTSDCKTALGNF